MSQAGLGSARWSSRFEGSAEGEAGEAEDDGVAEDANGAQPEHAGEWPDETDEAQRSAEKEPTPHEYGTPLTAHTEMGQVPE